jgi:DNA-binding HxlR family transcriptional regulator
MHVDASSRLPPTLGVETALRVLGGKWKVLIVWHLRGETRRYGTLRRLMPEITEKMLIRQLRELEQDGIIARYDYQSVPPHVEYTVTEYGQSLYPLLDGLCKWGWKHVEFEQESLPEKQIEAGG